MDEQFLLVTSGLGMVLLGAFQYIKKLLESKNVNDKQHVDELLKVKLALLKATDQRDDARRIARRYKKYLTKYKKRVRMREQQRRERIAHNKRKSNKNTKMPSQLGTKILGGARK